jgi:type IV secretion system protein VirB6
VWTPLGAEFNAILLPIIAGVAAALAAVLVPVLLAALTLWLVTQGAGLMTGGSSAPVPALLWKAAIIVAVGTLATTVAFTTGPLFQAWDGIRGEIATAFATASGGLVNAATPWAALDALGLELETALMQIRAEAAKVSSFYELPEYLTYLAAWVILGISGGVLQLVAGWLVMLSSLLGAFAIGLAPLFIAAAAFQASRQYFINWLTFLLSIATLSGVAMFCLAVSIRLSVWAFARAATFSATFTGSAADFLGVVLLLAVVQLLLAVLVFQGPSIASQMLGAAGIGQGGGLIQTAMLLSKISRGGAAAAPSAPSVGSITAPSGAYRGGLAAGAATRHVYQQVAARMGARASTRS